MIKRSANPSLGHEKNRCRHFVWRRLVSFYVACAIGACTGLSAAADSAVDGYVSELLNNCSTPGSTLDQRIAAFSGWHEANADTTPAIIDGLVDAFFANAIIRGEFTAADAEDIGPIMKERHLEDTLAPSDNNRALRVMTADGNDMVAVAVQSFADASFEVTTCQLWLSSPSAESLADLVGLFYLAHESQNPGVRTWNLGTSYALGDFTVTLDRILTVLVDASDGAETAVLTFTTHSQAF